MARAVKVEGGDATLLVRVHSATIGGDSKVIVGLRNTAPTPEQPQTDFVAAAPLAAATIDTSVEDASLLVVSLTGDLGSHVQVVVRGERVSVSDTVAAVLSAELVVRPTSRGARLPTGSSADVTLRWDEPSRRWVENRSVRATDGGHVTVDSELQVGGDLGVDGSLSIAGSMAVGGKHTLTITFESLTVSASDFVVLTNITDVLNAAGVGDFTAAWVEARAVIRPAGAVNSNARLASHTMWAWGRGDGAPNASSVVSHVSDGVMADMAVTTTAFQLRATNSGSSPVNISAALTIEWQATPPV